MKKNQKDACAAACWLAAFVLWTVLVRLVDVQRIGPLGSMVGFATLNRWVHGATGVHMTLYTLTDWLGLVPFGVALSFSVLGLVQWIRRKSIFRVDRSLLVLGGFYIVVIAVYLLFEAVVINYRPILIEGILEASYPSSTTLLVTSVMPTAILQCKARIQNKALRRCITHVIAFFIAFTVIGRLFSGVHWFTDIVGGILFSIGMIKAYVSLTRGRA